MEFQPTGTVEQLQDDIYKRVERPARRFNPLKVPKKLQAALPYASKPKLMKKQHRATYMQKRAVVLEPEEKRAVALLQQARALRKDQVACKADLRSKNRDCVCSAFNIHLTCRSKIHYEQSCLRMLRVPW